MTVKSRAFLFLPIAVSCLHLVSASVAVAFAMISTCSAGRCPRHTAPRPRLEEVGVCKTCPRCRCVNRDKDPAEMSCRGEGGVCRNGDHHPPSGVYLQFRCVVGVDCRCRGFNLIKAEVVVGGGFWVVKCEPQPPTSRLQRRSGTTTCPNGLLYQDQEIND